MQPTRVNKFVALANISMSRRAADRAIEMGRIRINGELATPGSLVKENDQVTIDGRILTTPKQLVTVIFHKPTGYVCSKRGQGNKTIYDLLPESFRSLNPVGRLDKDSSGLLLLTNNGQLAQELTHPSSEKKKVYEIKLNKALSPKDFEKITKLGVLLGDGLSKFDVHSTNNLSPNSTFGNPAYEVSMSEGRNRQIRRTFQALDYKVTRIHRTQFGKYVIRNLKESAYKIVG